MRCWPDHCLTWGERIPPGARDTRVDTVMLSSRVRGKLTDVIRPKLYKIMVITKMIKSSEREKEIAGQMLAEICLL